MSLFRDLLPSCLMSFFPSLTALTPQPDWLHTLPPQTPQSSSFSMGRAPGFPLPFSECQGMGTTLIFMGGLLLPSLTFCNSFTLFKLALSLLLLIPRFSPKQPTDNHATTMPRNARRTPPVQWLKWVEPVLDIALPTWKIRFQVRSQMLSTPEEPPFLDQRSNRKRSQHTPKVPLTLS